MRARGRGHLSLSLSKFALITKEKPDGSVKHRLIWDLLRSNVNAIIRRTIYRGVETLRKKKETRKLRTGKSEYVWNDEDKIQTREMPYLRIVSNHLWYQANEVLPLDGVRDVVLARVKEFHEKGGAVAAELKKLDKEEKRLVAGIERLSAAVESGDGALASLTSRLAERERELAMVRARRQDVEEQAGRKGKLPTAAKLLEHLEAVKGQLLGDEGRAAVILRQILDGPIRVMPFMRIDGKRVVPRLEFTINLVAALPSVVAGPLRQAAAAEGDTPSGTPSVMLKRLLLVNAFAEPQLVKHARVIVEQRLAGKTYKAIAKELDLTEYHMENCAAIVRLMEAAGLTEPYRRLTEKPDHVPQWCSKHWLKAGDRKGGGKRRRAS